MFQTDSKSFKVKPQKKEMAFKSAKDGEQPTTVFGELKLSEKLSH